MSKERDEELQKDYCTPETAALVVSTAENVLGALVCRRSVWLDPCAGDGAFRAASRAAGWRMNEYDIAPERDGILVADLFKSKIGWPCEPTRGGFFAVIINPPFNTTDGSQSQLACDCLKRCARLGAQVIVAVLPNIARTWKWQARMTPGWRLVALQELPILGFRRRKKLRKVLCSAHIWLAPGVRPDLPDLRLTGPEPDTNPDFKETRYWYVTKEGTVPVDDWDLALQSNSGAMDTDRAIRIVDLKAGEIPDPMIAHWLLVRAAPKVCKVLKGISWRPAARRRSTTMCHITRPLVVQEYVRAIASQHAQRIPRSMRNRRRRAR